MALDRKILEIVSDQSLRPVEIARTLQRLGWPDITTQRVASRLKALVTRGLVTRLRPSGGPRNGPGTSLYRVRRDEDSSSGG